MPRPAREAIARRRLQIDSDIANSVIAEEVEDQSDIDSHENDESSDEGWLTDNPAHSDDADEDSDEVLVPWPESSPQLFAIIPKQKFVSVRSVSLLKLVLL